MMQASLLADSFAAQRGPSAQHTPIALRGADGPAILRAMLRRFAIGRRAAAGTERLSDHLLRDIGLSRADIQALRF